MRHSLDNLHFAESVDASIGFEGNAAKEYFKCLSKAILPEEFKFRGRSTRPPKDPFNSMLSFGYSIFYRNIIGAIERHGLHPYFAFMHKSKLGHASLASDLIEDLRAPLVDKLFSILSTPEK
jgi:CRISPR-associated protein Cas1